MATYKAEFLSHYYAGRLRPRSAYAMGLFYWWARLASLAPSLANALIRAPGLSRVARLAAGVSPQRAMPAFARQTFRRWWRRRPTRAETTGVIAATQRVLLWPDTFNNHFHPETAVAAVEVLEAAGFRVDVPRGSLCCGRPLYDFGMLDTAKRLLRQVLDVLAPELDAGTPIVVLEPSCASVFRDELVNLFPDDVNVRRLKAQTYLLSEFLERFAPDFQTPTLQRAALVQGHCHQQAVLGMRDESAVLKKHVASCETLDAGCCGMAGAFGFESDHYAISIACGERALLPAVRNAPRETIIVADGFSCREQIAQTTDRTALHLAEVLRLALHEGEDTTPGAYPERAIKPLATPRAPWATPLVLVGSVGLLAAVFARWRRGRRKSAY
jgi:Fe-S oxidoreductase